MTTSRFISAIGTPLNDDGTLHRSGLRAHLDDQWQAGIDGVLVAGTMGQMQLLSDQAYAQLVEAAAEFSAGRGEVMIGVGDTSLHRTLDRIELVNRYPVDAAVVLTPYYAQFTQEELVDYYTALADVSRHPLYLYNLPPRTVSQLEVDTVEKVADHPNIAGIKCSVDLEFARELLRRIGDRFRVIVAEPKQIDTLIRDGVVEHLDGIYAVAPAWTVELGRAADAGDWDRAAACQQRLTALLDLLRSHPVAPAFTTMLNACGIPGNYAPAPYRPLSDSQRQTLLAHPVMRQLLDATPAP